MIGKSILHYTITEKLGEGGMGVVYKAEDTKLERTVALKFLSQSLMGGKEENERFKREAKAAAALNHPNIAHVYAVDEVDGQAFIAMEYVEGKSIEEIVGATGPAAAGPLPLDDAINYAIQIAAGLQAAHEKGVVHRDIKSANIMVTDKGVVKIMDFGLAKLANRSKMTVQGTTLGTAAYMSPEQAQGESVDHRSDIWSLGVVLYEMVSGQMPFKGDYEQAVIYSILHEEPEPLTALRSGLPIALDGIIAKAMAKDPNTRYQHVDELPADLKALAGPGSSLSRIASASVIVPPAETKKLVKFPWMMASLFLVCAAVFATLYFLRPPARENTMRFVIPPENEFSNYSSVVVSPDGRSLVIGSEFKSQNLLWLRPLNALEASPLAGTEDGEYPFWSPDSRYIAFFAGGKLKKVAAGGGPSQVLCDAPSTFGGSWSKSNIIIFSAEINQGLMKVSAFGGVPEIMKSQAASGSRFSIRWPIFMPDGNHFLYFLRSFDEGNSSIMAGSLNSPEVRKVMESNNSVIYSKAGYLLFVQESTVMAQPFDADKIKLGAQPVSVAQGVGTRINLNLADFSVSDNGILVYGAGRITKRRLLWFDRAGKEISAIGPKADYFDVVLSPGNDKVAVQRNSGSNNADIWILDLLNNIPTRFTINSFIEDDPVWSPDGKTLIFSSPRNGFRDIYVKPSDGSREEKPLLISPTIKIPTSWSIDGKYLLFTDDRDLKILPLEGEEKPLPYLVSKFEEQYAYFSPNGKWVAYTSNESRQWEVFVQAFPKSGGKWQISQNGGAQPKWARSGKELFYIAPDNTLMSVNVQTDGPFTAGVPKPVFKTRVDNYQNPNRYDVSADGKRFLINVPDKQSASSPVIVVVNWDAELQIR